MQTLIEASRAGPADDWPVDWRSRPSVPSPGERPRRWDGMRVAHVAIVVVAVAVAVAAIGSLVAAVVDRPAGHQALLVFGASLVAADLPACGYLIWRAARADDEGWTT